MKLHSSFLAPDLTPGDLGEVQPGDVAAAADALSVLAGVLPLNGRDYGSNALDSLLYALLVGWECEEHPDGPDCDDEDMCGGSGAFTAVADQHGWDREQQDAVRRMRAGIAALTLARRP